MFFIVRKQEYNGNQNFFSEKYLSAAVDNINHNVDFVVEELISDTLSASL